MKKYQKGLILLILPFIYLFGQDPVNEEFRSTWVITWNAYSGSLSTEELKTRTRRILDDHVEANMNAVIWQVRQGGTSYYSSEHEPWGYYLGYKDPGYDPLEYVIEEAHKRGLEVHAWFNAFHTSSSRPGTPAAEHPEWICRDADDNPMPDNYCLSPGLEAVREYTRDVALDIVNRYDIDGLHFDYIRWNEYSSKTVHLDDEEPLDGMFPDEIIEGMEKGSRYLYDVEHPYSGGVPDSIPGVAYSSWEKYWRHSTDQFIEMVHDSVQQVKPWVRVSAAALGRYKKWSGYYTVFQDAAKWFNEGWVDHLTPMHYHWTTASGFYGALTTDWEPEIQEGIAAGRFYSVGPGSYNFGTNWDNHPSVVNTCRTLPWVDGFQFFSYGSWQDQKYWEEAGETFFRRKTRMKPMTYVSEVAPEDPPHVQVTKLDDNDYEVTFSMPESVTEPHWQVIYRGKYDSWAPDEDEIIAMSFSTVPMTIREYFDGTQTFSETYGYYGITYNRYWNPSPPSEISFTDPIISYPPMVTASSVAEGDTVAVNTTLELEFSKRMDPDDFAEKVTLEPEGPALNFKWDRLNWTSGGRKVTISFASNLDYGVTYTLTLPGDLQDAGGMLLDGNGDQTGGDPWILTFVTRDEDLEPPVLVSVRPDQAPEAMDITEAITLRFDEFIDPATVSPDKIFMTSDGIPVTPDAFLMDYGNISVLNIRSYSRLVSGAPMSLTIAEGVADTNGNAIEEPLQFTFQTKNYYYDEQKILENFMGEGDWRDPTYSGSTAGVLGSGSSFEKSAEDNYLPGSAMDETMRRSGRLIYTWDMESTDGWFLREHIGTSAPTQISIDTSWTFQAYVYGDSSLNLIRFSLYETGGDGIAEVSQWDTLDWVGWKLITWDLWDPDQTGLWEGVGEGTMDGSSYRLESIQLTRTDESAESGKIWVDDIRIVKRKAGQAPSNLPPVIESFPDTTIEQGKYLRLFVHYEDPNPEDNHQFICEADTADIRFRIIGHSSGDRIYVRPEDTFVGQSLIRIIVKDFGVGELSDTTEFTLTVTPVSSVEETGIPKEFALHGNYPNPFNPATTIRFDLPEREFVRLSVFDIRGSHVTDLVKGVKEPGFYEVLFDGSPYASGLYLIRLQAGKQTAVQRMILMK